jgi:NMD protein affecting ribosome stability and mRNA decay
MIFWSDGKMIICSHCGKPSPKSYTGLCQGCYKYFRDGGKIHSLPEYGTIQRDETGKVICHICGKSYTRLGSHIRESHGMTIAEYKETFGLCSNSRTTEKSYSQTMRDKAYEHGMDKQLLEAGKPTRIKAGQTDKRKNKPVRAQEIIEKRQRRRREN